MVEPATEVDGVCDDVDEDDDLVARPAQDESATDRQGRDKGITSCLVSACCTGRRSNLISYQACTIRSRL